MPNLRSSQHVAVAALAVDLTASGNAPTEFRLLPLGRFKSADGSGRPVEVRDGWLLDAPGAKSIADLSARRVSKRVIDYEHQTLRCADNGKPAPASGWMGKLEARADGLWAVDVEWTAQAAEMIADKRYRYVSPVFPYDKRTGEVLGVAHAALTNDPGLDGLTDLAAMTALANQFFTPPEELPMKDLLKALGLPETATEAEALAALSAIKTTQVGELAAMKSAVPDPAKYVELATLTAVRGELATATTELAALKAKTHADEVDKAVAAALSVGKLTPAMEGWAKSLGKTDLAALTAYVDAAPVVVKPGETQTGGKPAGDGKSHQHTDVDTAVMKALGLTAEQFAAGKLQEV
jgi:phage I-like protein